jgi:hypothetical protein
LGISSRRIRYLRALTIKLYDSDCAQREPIHSDTRIRFAGVSPHGHFVRTDRVKNPADVKGKKVGVPEYQLTANVWARAFLADDYGINPSDIYWIRGGIESPVRPEWLRPLQAPTSSPWCARLSSPGTAWVDPAFRDQVPQPLGLDPQRLIAYVLCSLLVLGVFIGCVWSS